VEKGGHREQNQGGPILHRVLSAWSSQGRRDGDVAAPGQSQAQLLSPPWPPAPGSHGGGLAGPVVAQQGGDLPLVEVQAQPVDSHVAAVAVNLHQVADGDTRLELGRRLLHQLWKPPGGSHPGQDPLPGAGPLAGGQSPGRRAQAQPRGCQPSATQLQGGQGRGSPWGVVRGLVGYGGCPAEDGSPSQ